MEDVYTISDHDRYQMHLADQSGRLERIMITAR
jgi:hypothetical protein